MSVGLELGASGFSSGFGEEAPDSTPFPSYQTPGSGPASGSYASLPNEDPQVVHPNDKYICPVHLGLLRDAVQTPCGHRMCAQCVGSYLADSPSKICPANEEDCEQITASNILPDPGFRREMKQLLVHCFNKDKGCEEKLKFGELSKHSPNCEHRLVVCRHSSRGCQDSMLFKDSLKHEETCKHRPTLCDLCGEEYSAFQQQEHEESTCPEAMVLCPYQCGDVKYKRRLLEEHKADCPKKPTECKFNILGCNFVGHKEEVSLHEKDVTSHFAVVCEFALSSEMQRKKESDELQFLKQKVEQLSKEIEALNGTLKNTHRELKLKMVQQVERLIIAEQKVAEISGGAPAGSTPDVQHVQQSIEQLKLLIPQVSNHDRQIANHEIRTAEMDLRFQMLETASYDGKLLWKIRDFSQRKRDAVQGRTVSLYSQPFYTGRFGYKMCARVYLNGDGIGRGTHMSLYFVVMKGEYDALLPWPFQQRVSLILLDQSPDKRHLKDEFFPDPNSTSFRRPVNAEMNVASGCPLFVAHTVLDNPSNHYIKDDTLFIKVVVDTASLQTI